MKAGWLLMEYLAVPIAQIMSECWYEGSHPSRVERPGMNLFANAAWNSCANLIVDKPITSETNILISPN